MRQGVLAHPPRDAAPRGGRARHETAIADMAAATGLVRWPQAFTMLIGAVIGGYWGARGARLVNPHALRAGITVFNVVMTVIFFIRSMKWIFQ